MEEQSPSNVTNLCGTGSTPKSHSQPVPKTIDPCNDLESPRETLDSLLEKDNTQQSPIFNSFRLQEVDTDSNAAKINTVKIKKGILVISLAFLLNFVSFYGLSILQSSLHQQEGMGVINQSLVYCALVLSCLFLPKLIISKIGHKWTMAISSFGYLLWMAANGYARWATMIPASIIMGVCAAPLWTSQCVYFTQAAIEYSKIKGENQDKIISNFFAFFYFILRFSYIIGSIFSSAVLQHKPENASQPADEVLSKCGAANCPWQISENANLEKPSTVLVWTLVGIFLVLSASSIVLILLFVTELPRSDSKSEDAKKQTVSMLLATLKHMKNKKQILLVPLTTYIGIKFTFVMADYSLSYVSCTIGMWMVGYVMIPHGICAAFASYASSWFAKYTGRLAVISTAFVLDLSIQVTLFAWKPHPDMAVVFFVVSAIWGLADGIMLTQINALYGSLFADNSEAAFSSYKVWESAGYIVAFAYSNFLCTYIKLAILTALLTVGMAGYCIVDRKQHQVQQSSPANNELQS